MSSKKFDVIRALEIGDFTLLEKVMSDRVWLSSTDIALLTREYISDSWLHQAVEIGNKDIVTLLLKVNQCKRMGEPVFNINAIIDKHTLLQLACKK